MSISPKATRKTPAKTLTNTPANKSARATATSSTKPRFEFIYLTLPAAQRRKITGGRLDDALDEAAYQFSDFAGAKRTVFPPDLSLVRQAIEMVLDLLSKQRIYKYHKQLFQASYGKDGFINRLGQVFAGYLQLRSHNDQPPLALTLSNGQVMREVNMLGALAMMQAERAAQAIKQGRVTAAVDLAFDVVLLLNCAHGYDKATQREREARQKSLKMNQARNAARDEAVALVTADWAQRRTSKGWTKSAEQAGLYYADWLAQHHPQLKPSRSAQYMPRTVSGWIRAFAKQQGIALR